MNVPYRYLPQSSKSFYMFSTVFSYLIQPNRILGKFSGWWKLFIKFWVYWIPPQITLDSLLDFQHLSFPFQLFNLNPGRFRRRQILILILLFKFLRMNSLIDFLTEYFSNVICRAIRCTSVKVCWESFALLSCFIFFEYLYVKICYWNKISKFSIDKMKFWLLTFGLLIGLWPRTILDIDFYQWFY